MWLNPSCFTNGLPHDMFSPCNWYGHEYRLLPGFAVFVYLSIVHINESSTRTKMDDEQYIIQYYNTL